MSTEQLTFFSGLQTTGGVQILYGNGKNGVLFDFGISHRGVINAAYPHTHEPVRPTPGREIRQLLLSRAAPPLLNIYDFDQTQSVSEQEISKVWDNKVFPQYETISIFIGHMHQDHMALLPYLNENVTVYINSDAYSLYKGVVASGEYRGSKANIIPLEDLSVIDFGDFFVQIIEMDHNSIGASGYMIESENYVIAKTGDWRLNGRHPERIDRFIETCRDTKLDVLFTEATSVNFQDQPKISLRKNESEMVSKFEDCLKQAEALIYVHILTRDPERMADFIISVINSGRRVVLETSLAIIWHEAISIGMRTLTDHPACAEIKNIKVVDTGDEKREKALPYETISLEEIATNKMQYVYFLYFPKLAQIIELETTGESCGVSHIVHGDHPVKLDNSPLGRYVKEYGIIQHSISCGGHPRPEEISELVSQIAPKTVIPVHCWNPKGVSTPGVKRLFPERGDTFSVADILSLSKIE